jgi:multisubunit Na+/H+ antiporter MnhB subunit
VPDWIWSFVSGLQRSIAGGLAAELRAGGAFTAVLAVTIGTVALAAIVIRRVLGQALAAHLPGVERWTRRLQAVAGAAIMLIAGYALWRAYA